MRVRVRVRARVRARARVRGRVRNSRHTWRRVAVATSRLVFHP